MFLNVLRISALKVELFTPIRTKPCNRKHRYTFNLIDRYPVRQENNIIIINKRFWKNKVVQHYGPYCTDEQ